MSPEEIHEKFDKICRHGNDADRFMKFFEYLLPMYELRKKGIFTKIIKMTHISLVDAIWEDPMDLYLYGRLSELIKLANYLEIKIEKENAI